MAEKLLVYHNPGCSKSRGILEILRERGVEFDVVEYLKQPPDRATLERIVDAAAPEDPSVLVRKDAHFKELGLDPAHYTTKEQVVEVLLAHPRLMERPVIFRGSRAVIGRPPERVLELLD